MGHDEGVAAELRGRGPARLRGFESRDCSNRAAVMGGYDEIQAVSLKPDADGLNDQLRSQRISAG